MVTQQHLLLHIYVYVLTDQSGWRLYKTVKHHLQLPHVAIMEQNLRLPVNMKTIPTFTYRNIKKG